MSKKLLVTAALPYANGDIHLGHMVEHCQLDIWVRAKKMSGVESYVFCADDTHGTSIMIGAKKRGITPQELVAEMRNNHMADFEAFGIEYNHYSSTDSETNREILEEIYQVMLNKNLLETRDIEQYYCGTCAMFLPDRFIKGECPSCGSKDQNGDSCDKCGLTYNPTELKNPYCVTCESPKEKPYMKTSRHLFFKLEPFREFLKDWVQKTNDPSVIKKLSEWLSGELQDWNISRDEPYFGFKIPGYTDKYFYVWVDAPVCYISATKEWAKANGKKVEDFWCNDEVEIIHFIGKDIVYFHSLFWPSLLKHSRYNLPSKIFAHGFLTVNGEKMSKSKGTFILAKDYRQHLDINHFRYYLATKLDNSISDFDFNVEDFQNKINSDLIGKITNLASRGAQMLNKNFEGQLTQMDEEGREIYKRLCSKKETIITLYDGREYHKATTEIREMAEEVNRYFDKHKPWELIKDNRDLTQAILTTVVNTFRVMAIYMTPIVPTYAKKVQEIFLEKNWTFSDVSTCLENRKIGAYVHLSQRVDAEKIKQVF